MSNSKYSIKVKLLGDDEGYNKTTFASKRAFAQSSLWELIKESDLAGTLTVIYGPGYKNECNFINFDTMKTFLEIATEKELLNVGWE